MDHDRPRKKSELGSRSEAQGLPCTPCTTLCVSVHQPFSQECHIRGCYICADFARVNDKITTTYKRLSDLVAERQKYMTKTGHDTLIHRMPVEILCSVFVEVKKVLDFIPPEHPNHIVQDIEPQFRQPSTSPPLLVGAVCKRWRDISLAKPQLWTNITINLRKSEKGQVNMVREWARRSGSLPLDITISTNESLFTLSEERYPKFSNLLSTVRSLAPRWNDLAFHIPASTCHNLLDSLESAPAINSLLLHDVCLEDSQLTHPLRPNRLLCNVLSDTVMSLEWDRLTFLQIRMSSLDEILYIIQHAESLKHCNVGEANGDGPDIPITHHSLVSFATFAGSKVLRHLTLPSLQHLEYRLYNYDHDEIDELVEFFDRSRAPLNIFKCRYNVPLHHPFPPLESLYWVTSLFIELDHTTGDPDAASIDDFLALLLPSPSDALSRLKKITFELPDLTAESWSLLGRLFWYEDADPSVTSTNDYSPTRKARSGACIPLSDDIKAAMKTQVILRLLEVKQSGVDINIEGPDGSDVLIL